MPRKKTQFVITPELPIEGVRATLHLSQMASEILFGHERMTLETGWTLNRKRRLITIDTHSKPGETLALVFLGFCRREFGAEAVKVVHSSAKQVAAGSLA